MARVGKLPAADASARAEARLALDRTDVRRALLDQLPERLLEPGIDTHRQGRPGRDLGDPRLELLRREDTRVRAVHLERVQPAAVVADADVAERLEIIDPGPELVDVVET